MPARARTTGPVHAHAEFDAAGLVAAKADRTVSVCIPARNEAATIGPIVEGIVVAADRGRRRRALVDEVLVVDDGSTDGTGAIAAAGRGPGDRRRHGRAAGKGQAMRVALREPP